MKLPPLDDPQALDALVARFLSFIGRRINVRRNAIGMSQEKLADGAHVSRSEVHNIENGLTNERVGTLFRVCHAVGLGIGEVVCHAEYQVDHASAEATKRPLKSQRGKNTRRPLY